MRLMATVGTNEESAAVVRPSEGAFYDPALTSEAGAVFGLASRDDRLDASPDEATVLAVVVATICDDALRTSPRSADAAAYRRHPIEQREQLRDAVAVAAGEHPGQRQSAAVYEEMLLAAAAKIDAAALREAQSRKDAVRAYELVDAALGGE